MIKESMVDDIKLAASSKLAKSRKLLPILGAIGTGLAGAAALTSGVPEGTQSEFDKNWAGVIAPRTPSPIALPPKVSKAPKAHDTTFLDDALRKFNAIPIYSSQSSAPNPWASNAPVGRPPTRPAFDNGTAIVRNVPKSVR